MADRLEIFTLNRNDRLCCTENWAWSRSVNKYNRKIMLLPIRTITYITQSGPGPSSEPPGPVNLYRLPRPPVDTGWGQTRCHTKQRLQDGLKNPLTFFQETKHAENVYTLYMKHSFLVFKSTHSSKPVPFFILLHILNRICFVVLQLMTNAYSYMALLRKVNEGDDA